MLPEHESGHHSGLQITRVQIVLASPAEHPLCGYCSVTINESLVIHDLRILRRGDRLFVAMPSRKRTSPCPKCGFKNPLQSRYCTSCGSGLADRGSGRSAAERIHVDIAHPVNQSFREQLERAVIEEYRRAASSGFPGPGSPPLPHQSVRDPLTGSHSSC